jgi:hypothetical protein
MTWGPPLADARLCRAVFVIAILATRLRASRCRVEILGPISAAISLQHYRFILLV